MKGRNSFMLMAMVGIFALSAFSIPCFANPQVEFLNHNEFGPSAVVEGFEGIVGNTLQPDPMWPGFSEAVPFPFELESGAILSGGDDVAIYDELYDPNGWGGWGLGMDGSGNIHDVRYDTVIPSETSYLASIGQPPLMEITFPEPVTKVGAWVETVMETISFEAFDTNGVSLGSVSIVPDGTFYDDAVDSWIGLSSETPIGKVVIDHFCFVMDDLTFESDGASLSTDVDTITEAGGTVNFSLDAGGDNGSRKYLLVGGISGSSPGLALPGGLVTLPVNWDLFSDLEMMLLNTVVFSNFMGILDVDGVATAQMNLPALPTGSVGTVITFAYCCNAPFDLVSNTVEIEVVN